MTKKCQQFPVAVTLSRQGDSGFTFCNFAPYRPGETHDKQVYRLDDRIEMTSESRNMILSVLSPNPP